MMLLHVPLRTAGRALAATSHQFTELGLLLLRSQSVILLVLLLLLLDVGEDPQLLVLGVVWVYQARLSDIVGLPRLLLHPLGRGVNLIGNRFLRRQLTIAPCRGNGRRHEKRQEGSSRGTTVKLSRRQIGRRRHESRCPRFPHDPQRGQRNHCCKGCRNAGGPAQCRLPGRSCPPVVHRPWHDHSATPRRIAKLRQFSKRCLES
mmetsp:Transcript_60764/g.131787  ORF Transcript_60764/g.131787 Transcript_60764/m.131787 type:complete len:204 (-) Transcript_60764:7-618(-)